MKGKCIDNTCYEGHLTVGKIYDLSISGSFVSLTCDDGCARAIAIERFEIIENEGEESCDCKGWKEKAENETRRADELYDQLQTAKQEIIELKNKVAGCEASLENLSGDLTYMQQELDRTKELYENRLYTLDVQRNDLLKCIKVIMGNI